MNRVIEKGKPQCKIPFKIFKETDRYDPLFGISPFPTLIQLAEYLGDIQHCVTVVGKWIFNRSIPFLFLSFVMIWSTVVQMKMKKINELLQRIVKIYYVFFNR